MAKRQKLGYSFVPFPRFVLEHESFGRLSGNAVKLLCNFMTMYTGTNNGNLSCAWKLMRPMGWTSNDFLQRALKELLYFEFIIMTRQGGRHQCSLYAIAFYDISEFPGKNLEVGPCIRSSNWMNARPPMPDMKKRKPPPPETRKGARKNENAIPVVGTVSGAIEPVAGTQIH